MRSISKNTRRSFLKSTVLAGGFVFTTSPFAALSRSLQNKSLRLIIDADTANEIDDAFAIARALAEPSLNIEGISSAQWHTSERAPNDTVGLSQKMNEEILELMNKTNIPHPMGSNIPLVNEQRPQPSAAAEFIINMAHETKTKDKLTVVILGPCTNVASAILMDPTIIPKIKCCYLGLWYNQEENTWSKREFNTDNDPNALNVLLNTRELEIEIMTATTSKHLVFEKKMVDQQFKGKGGIFDYLVDRWENYERFWKKEDPEKQYWTMWDVATIEALAHPELAEKRKVITPHDNLKREIAIYSSIDVHGMINDFWRAFDKL